MKKNIFNLLTISTVLVLMTACQSAINEADLFETDSPDNIEKLTADGKLFTLDEFVNTFMTEKGNFYSDTSMYRTRSEMKDGIHQLFSVDTLPTNGPGIYIMGRIATDDYGGNFYKALVIQQIVNGEQQSLRISLDMGSAGGLYEIGQQILIRCNGLAVGRYSNQPQLCVPSYNNNNWAMNANQKVGWAPGRIPAAKFRRATKLIGVADPSKLVYDEMTMAELESKYISKFNDVELCRKLDGRLVRIINIHFTGEYENNGTPTPCNQYTYSADSTIITIGNPEYDQNANVLAPTTTNIGFPQSRIIANEDNSIKTLVSCSEYAKFAYYYIPCEIRGNFKEFHYDALIGSVSGILGFYNDNGSKDVTRYMWSISPRNLDDIKMTFKDSTPWIPSEFSVDHFVPSEWE